MANKITNIDTKTEKKKYRVTTFCDMVETYIVLAKDEDEARNIVLSGEVSRDDVSFQDEKIESVVD